jgi:hypothetical protein
MNQINATKLSIIGVGLVVVAMLTISAIANSLDYNSVLAMTMMPSNQTNMTSGSAGNMTNSTSAGSSNMTSGK